jgi:hypothetical protein
VLVKRRNGAKYAVEEKQMNPKFSIATVLATLLLCGIVGATSNKPAQATKSLSKPVVDLRSYRLGEIEAFSEMVAKGLKTVAISDVLTTEEADAIVNDSQYIAEKYGVQNYREPDLLVTNLFDESITKGKTVILIFKSPDTLAAYKQLKAEKARLIKEGHYDSAAQVDISRRFGRMLSYPDKEIERLLLDPQHES